MMSFARRSVFLSSSKKSPPPLLLRKRERERVRRQAGSRHSRIGRDTRSFGNVMHTADDVASIHPSVINRERETKCVQFLRERQRH